MNDALTLVEVKEVGKRDATYADIYQRLKSDWSSTPCYLVFDYETDTDEGKRQKLLFISWTPNGAKVKQKMVYAGTRGDLKSKLPGIQIDLQATDLSDIEESLVASKVK
jgi:cofilin